MSSHLSVEQQSILQSFKEITQISDEYLCVQILQQNQWNLDSSLGQYINSNENNSTSSSQRLDSANSGSRRSENSESSHVSNIRNSQNVMSDLTQNRGNSNSFGNYILP